LVRVRQYVRSHVQDPPPTLLKPCHHILVEATASDCARAAYAYFGAAIALIAVSGVLRRRDGD
jgi:hypothetical protein